MEQEQKNSQENSGEESQVRPTGNDFRADKRDLPKADLGEPKSKKRIVILIIAFVVLAAGAAGFLLLRKNSPVEQHGSNQTEQLEEQLPQTDPNTIKMLATGDWIAHDSVNEQAKTNGGYDYAPFLSAWQPIFERSDINFCNHATPAGGETYGISGYPVFNAPFEWIDAMSSLGCNVVNTGTNHTNDKGQRVITAQLDEWDKKEVLAVAGSNRNADEQSKVRYFDMKGVKFAFLSYSTYTNITNPNAYSLNMFNASLYEPQLAEANENADIVIVSMRWGDEYSPAVNAQQDSIAKTLSNLGADIILGHGPHVLEPVKKITSDSGGETYVWFSLGNFLNTQLETEALTGCVAALEIDVPTKSVKSNSCIPFYMHYEWTAEQAAAEDLLKRHNLKIVPLDTADELMTKSQLGTTSEEQLQRIKSIIGTFVEVPIIRSGEF